MATKKRQKANKGRGNLTRTNKLLKTKDLGLSKTKKEEVEASELVATNPVMQELAGLAEMGVVNESVLESVKIENNSDDSSSVEILSKHVSVEVDENVVKMGEGKGEQKDEAQDIVKEVIENVGVGTEKGETGKMARLTFRVDKELKEQANELFRNMGMTTAAALNLFLVQAVRCQGLPFRPSLREDFDWYTDEESGVHEEEGDSIEQLEMSLEEAEELVNGGKKERKYDNLEELIRRL